MSVEINRGRLIALMIAVIILGCPIIIGLLSSINSKLADISTDVSDIRAS